MEPSLYIRQRIAPMIPARVSESKPTLVHVPDKAKIKQFWGEAVSSLILDSYAEVHLG